MNVPEAADAVATLFPEIYRRLHARRARRDEPVGHGMAALQHLALTGPLTIGEAAAHFGRAQSVVSELVDRLARRGLVERMRDARDRRRTLVWLTPKARELLERAPQILSAERLADALGSMSSAERRGLVQGMRALVRGADEHRPGRPR
jgi:DNA-binding MarR family transcriptional regulator